MSDHNSPAARVIDKCGGIATTADMAGLHRTSVNRWMFPRERGGTGGTVPSGAAARLLIEAGKRGIDLHPDDFFCIPSEGIDRA